MYRQKDTRIASANDKEVLPTGECRKRLMIARCLVDEVLKVDAAIGACLIRRPTSWLLPPQSAEC